MINKMHSSFTLQEISKQYNKTMYELRRDLKKGLLKASKDLYHTYRVKHNNLERYLNILNLKQNLSYEEKFYMEEALGINNNCCTKNSFITNEFDNKLWNNLCDKKIAIKKIDNNIKYYKLTKLGICIIIEKMLDNKTYNKLNF